MSDLLNRYKSVTRLFFDFTRLILIILLCIYKCLPLPFTAFIAVKDCVKWVDETIDVQHRISEFLLILAQNYFNTHMIVSKHFFEKFYKSRLFFIYDSKRYFTSPHRENYFSGDRLILTITYHTLEQLNRYIQLLH